MMPSRRREPECLSDLRLDQLLSGELTGEPEQTARAHLASCPACAARQRELEQDRESFAASAPGFETLSLGAGAAASRATPALARAAQRRAWVAPLALAASVILGVGLQRVLSKHDGAVTSEQTRTKGGEASFACVVRRGEHGFVAEPGEILHPGDRLRFTVSSKQPVYAGIWGIDALERVSPYQLSPELSAVPAGQRQPLPEAVELDESLGQERLIGVFCGERLAVAQITLALQQSPLEPRLPGGCTSESLTVLKALP